MIRPVISHALIVLKYLPSLMHDTRLEPLSYFEILFALIAPTFYKCQSWPIALLQRWLVWLWNSQAKCKRTISMLVEGKAWGILIHFCFFDSNPDNHNQNFPERKSCDIALGLEQLCYCAHWPYTFIKRMKNCLSMREINLNLDLNDNL